MFRRPTLMILLAVTLAGCATDPCDWARPILSSSADVVTEGTMRQIVAHNEKGERFCGWVALR